MLALAAVAPAARELLAAVSVMKTQQDLLSLDQLSGPGHLRDIVSTLRKHRKFGVKAGVATKLLPLADNAHLLWD